MKYIWQLWLVPGAIAFWPLLLVEAYPTDVQVVAWKALRDAAAKVDDPSHDIFVSALECPARLDRQGSGDVSDFQV